MNGVTKIHQATFFLKCTESQPNNLSDIEKVETKYEFVTESEKSSHDTEKSVVIRFCDCLFISTIVQINVVGFWRGLFGILSFFHNFSHLSILFFLGGLIQLQFTIWRECYKKHLWKKKFSHFLLRKLYTYTCASSAVFFWAGLWFILDKISSFEVRPPLVYSVVSYVLLVCFKFSNNLLASPLFITTDSTVDDYFNFDTAFKTTLKKKRSSEISLYVLDCFFSVFVVGTLVVFIWRGVWSLTDVFLFPENEKYSALVSLAVGYSIVILVFGLQSPVKKMNEKLKGFWLLLFTDVHILVSFIGTINLWRGFWILFNVYFLPENPIWSNWLTHLGCFAILVLINCSNTILVRGVYLDGEESIVFPPFYFSLLLENLKKKKLKGKESNKKTNNSFNNKAEDVEKASKEDGENSDSEKKKSSQNEKIDVNIDTNEV